MPCTAVSSLAICTSSFAHLNVWNTSIRLFEISKPFKSFLGKILAEYFNTEPVSKNTLVESFSSLRTFDFWFVQSNHDSLTHEEFADYPYSCLLKTGFSRLWINLFYFTRSNALCHSMKNANNSSSMSEVRSDVFLNRETRRGKCTNFLLRCKSILLLE